MSERMIEEKLNAAFQHATPDALDAILADCGQRKGHVIQMTEKRKMNRGMKAFLAAAACLVLILTGAFGLHAYQSQYTVASTVSLDVNPSVEIAVNRKQQVLDVRALNEDGRIVIGDMDFSGCSIEVAANALVGSMVRNGYLNELANSILISVDGKDNALSASLRQKLTLEVDNLLNGDGAILCQTVVRDTDLEELAAQYGISVGKAQLIRQMVADNAYYSCEDLAGLNINELYLLHGSHCGDHEQLSCVGNASTKAYIGEDEARKLACLHANVDESRIQSCRLVLDENGQLAYSFCTDDEELDCSVNALTGAVVSCRGHAHENEGEHHGASGSTQDNDHHETSDSTQGNDHREEYGHHGGAEVKETVCSITETTPARVRRFETETCEVEQAHHGDTINRRTDDCWHTESGTAAHCGDGYEKHHRK